MKASSSVPTPRLARSRCGSSTARIRPDDPNLRLHDSGGSGRTTYASKNPR